MPALVTCVVRVFAACFLLVLAAAGAAQGQTVAQCVAKENPALPFYGIKTKKIRIFNNSPSTLWAVILRARAPFDEWMVGLCQLGKGTENIKFPTTLDYRLYVGGIDGIGPSQAVEVTVPWYTRLKDNPTGMGNDEFIDWFNGCLLYTSPSPRDRG